MNIPTVCPCCSNPMLHCLDHNREYWFCRNCWQEMPDLMSTMGKKCQQHNKQMNFSIRLSKFNQPVTA